MHLNANLETIDRLVEQGALILRSFHAQRENNPNGSEAEFLRGEFAGWRCTIHTEYHDCAEEIVDRVLAKTSLPVPECFNSLHFLCSTAYSWR
jgi:hypothetical protein